jgi:hypothetical protein
MARLKSLNSKDETKNLKSILNLLDSFFSIVDEFNLMNAFIQFSLLEFLIGSNL